jgi:hypothetical protein
LNDQYTFVSTATSLWDKYNQCKPAFYAAANVGINYNALASLIAYTDSLKQADYTTASWNNFTTILASAKIAKNQNYSLYVSADTSLVGAKNNLKAAIDGLVKNTTDVKSANNNYPKVFSLEQNYPNPFNPSTRIRYSVPQDGYLTIKIYNQIGQEVAALFEGLRQAGNYVAVFDGAKLASGVYFCRMQAGIFTDAKKLILCK